MRLTGWPAARQPPARGSYFRAQSDRVFGKRVSRADLDLERQGKEDDMKNTSIFATALAVAFALGAAISGAEAQGKGKGGGGGSPAGIGSGNFGATSGWLNGRPPGWSSPGQREGWTNDEPPGFEKSREKAPPWEGLTLPPGLTK
jgi:hypothetical protein